jgi:PAS domain S-box-containing protein
VTSTLRFRTKLNLGIITIVAATALVLALVISQVAARALEDESKRTGSVLVENLSMRAAEPLLGGDLLRLKDLVDELPQVEENILYAFVTDDSGRVLVHTFQGGFPVQLTTANTTPEGRGVAIQLLDTGQELVYDFAAPVLVAGDRLGSVRLGLTRQKVLSVVNRLLWAVYATAGTAFVAALLASTYFAGRVTRRLNALRCHAEEIVRGNLDHQAAPPVYRNCWEVLDCGSEQCPAYGTRGACCWHLAGALNPACKTGDCPGAGKTCDVCPVYLENRGDEIQELAETFDVMSRALKTHIEELRAAEARVKRQERLMRTVLDASPDQMSMVDDKLVYLAVNRTFSQALGRRPDEVAGLTSKDLFPPDDAARRDRDNLDVMRSGKPASREIPFFDGERDRWFHEVRLPVADADGRVIGLLRSARDITDMKEVQEQLIHSQKMESVGKLAGGVAHEINTPLGIILGYTQLLQEDAPEGGQLASDLAIIEKQAKVCRKIVADLLGFSRQTESAKLHMCFNNSVLEVVSLVQHAFSLDKVAIVTDMDDRMPIIYGDPEKLKQVWLNLLGNALDAMPEGGVIMVRTHLDTPRMQVTLEVVDSGQGIRREDLQKIFDPFYSTKPVGQGTGLGLSVSFGIIEDHDGSIRAASPAPEDLLRKARERAGILEDAVSGPGSILTVELPLDHTTEENEQA